MCDCAVALGSATARRATLFGKNSDREALEAQPLRALPATEHTAGARASCTHIEIPQVRETAAVLGSGPFWCWGLEQGVNEHGLAIGNELVMTHEELELGEPGLLGMDLVRLGLERARSAREAVETLGGLIERFGQGGGGFLHKPIAHSNGFLLADASEAWSLQSSSRRWVARRIDGLGAISNHPSIGADWELGSADVESFAIERGWWSPERGRLDFEAAYRSTRLVSAGFSDLRQRRTTELLEASRGALQEPDLFRLLRDHGGGLAPPPDDPADERRYTLCAHNGLQGDTTASMAVSFDRPVCWFALGSPCCSVYLPLYVGAKLPDALAAGGEAPDEASAWWRFKRLQQGVEADFAGRLPRVREAFEPLEQEWLAAAAATDDPEGRMQAALAQALEVCGALTADLAA
jgi:dipeptidase